MTLRLSRFWGWWAGLLVVLCYQVCLAGSPIGLLLIFDSKQSQGLRMHRSLVEFLKQKRSEGHYAGTGLGRHFFAYDLAEPAHAAALKKMGVSRGPKPLITLTELDSKGSLPVKITWRCAYESPEQALQKVDQQLGIAPMKTPAGVFCPPGYGFSLEIPYPVTQSTPLGGSTLWTASQQGEGLAIVGVGNITSAPEDRQQTLDAVMTAFLRDSGIREISREEFTQEGMSGVKVTGRHEAYLAQVRILCSDSRLYQLALISFRNDESVVQRFFESLSVSKP
jgi:hypothetical protein